MPPSADQLPKCPKCESRPAREQRIDTVQTLGIDELRGYEREIERIGSGGYRHEVDAADVVGEYDVEEVQRCSYFKHRHHHGLLIIARCGALLSIGNDCGRKYVVGFRKVERELGIVRAIATERLLLQTEPKRIFESLRRLAAEVERRLDGVERLRELAPKIFESMQRAHLMGDEGVFVSVMRFDPRTNTKRRERDHRLLVGMRLFRGNASRTKVREIVDQAASFLREAVSLQIDRTNYPQVQNDRKALGDHEVTLQRWLDETSSFWTEENLALALIKTYGDRVPNGLTVEGRMIVIAGTPISAIGIEG